MSLKGKTIFITGGSRGIGRAIALRCAQDGANIIIAAKTDTPHTSLPGTIYTVAEEIQVAGGQCLPIKLDARQESQIQEAVQKAVDHFGGIDIVVNNASAINLTGTLQTPVNRFDLMMAVNVRATFATIQACLPHLFKAANPHVLTLSPPLNMDPKWFKKHVAYTMSKYGMSMCVLGMAEEFRNQGVAFNALWPVTAIATDAFKAIDPNIPVDCMRKPEIVAEAAYAIFNRPAAGCTGNFFTDEEVLLAEGYDDLSCYAVKEGASLLPDFFLD
ncbi:SDR family oxidoreductase [Candidatus Odyssella thessalonicensis]|uniref:SDR family oxidoreductase n=1 Tax=Candidatus Odyssella thessalonicensis TaxID=84647 RepID=UPI000225B1D0|nr:NAD(P)-dependent oxidoreductase [Candidatus Odyssella thessalonicensis]